MKIRFLIALILVTALITACAKKEAPVVDATVAPVKVAVNSEFLPTAKLLADQFTASTAIGVELTSGTDEELRGMIEEGADIDVLMASNAKYPRELIAQGKALSDGAFVYALGTPALYSKSWKLNWNAYQFLQSGQFAHLSIPNPDSNRYGSAGVAVLESMGVYRSAQDRLVYTENASESLKMIESREVDAGFIAYSSLSDANKRWAWIVPEDLYPPIELGAVILKKDGINKSSEIWMGYLGSDQARSIIRQSGYGVVEIEDASSNN